MKKENSSSGKLWLEAKVKCGLCGLFSHMTPGDPSIKSITHFESDLREDGWRKSRKHGWVCGWICEGGRRSKPSPKPKKSFRPTKASPF